MTEGNAPLIEGRFPMLAGPVEWQSLTLHVLIDLEVRVPPLLRSGPACDTMRRAEYAGSSQATVV